MLLFAEVVLAGLAVATAYLLVGKYRRARDAGLLWLGVLLVIWPLANLCLWIMRLNLWRVGSSRLMEVADFLWPHYWYLYRFGAPVLGLIAVAMLYRKKRETSQAE